ncbi:hypothetical protein BMS3Bbin04_01521 [bacterium BMS3Bbin04]|nr:hypothetical protein BMS3Bbin04_01521 [bacterium BMS3Bbin04]
MPAARQDDELCHAPDIYVWDHPRVNTEILLVPAARQDDEHGYTLMTKCPSILGHNHVFIPAGTARRGTVLSTLATIMQIDSIIKLHVYTAAQTAASRCRAS